MIKTPAQNLEGQTLPCGWEVIKYIPKEQGQTGGNFSIGYEAEKDGQKAFLKALDLKKLMIARGMTDPLQSMTLMMESFKYERDILKDCREAGLSKVIRSLSDGSILLDNTMVPYIVFEFASGDIREQAISQAGFDLLWVLRTTHQVFVGIKQLHGKGISHQDIKPSNILLVENGDRKIGDFGTCVTKGCKLPHVNFSIAGDRTYAPPEGLYGFEHSDWSIRRCGNDAYQAGSLIVFMIIGTPVTTFLISHLDDEYRPGVWRGTYEQVLPYLEEAFVRVIEALESHIPTALGNDIRNGLVTIIKELCKPSIFLRGDPVQYRKKTNPFSMERYISRIDRISLMTECKITRTVKL